MVILLSLDNLFPMPSSISVFSAFSQTAQVWQDMGTVNQEVLGLQSSADFTGSSKLCNTVCFCLICYQVLTPSPNTVQVGLDFTTYLETILNIQSSCLQYRLVINMSHQAEFYKVQGSRLSPGLSTCKEKHHQMSYTLGLYYSFCFIYEAKVLLCCLDCPWTLSQMIFLPQPPKSPGFTGACYYTREILCWYIAGIYWVLNWLNTCPLPRIHIL